MSVHDEHIERAFESADGPSKRLQAFMESRTQLPTETTDIPETGKARKGARKKEAAPPQSAAAYRLQALREQREAQTPAAKPASTRAKRDPLPAPTVAGGYWRPLGPFGVRKGQAPGDPVISGRVSRIAVSPDGKRVYLATANSGVWRSDDKGESWRALMGADFDKNPENRGTDSLACGAIAVVTDPISGKDTIFVGTGEGDARDHGGVGSGAYGTGYFGIGVMVSKDGGLNWEPNREGELLFTGNAFFGMAVHPDKPDSILAATSVGVYYRGKTSPGVWDQMRNFKNAPAAAPFIPSFCPSIASAKQGGVTAFFAYVEGGGNKGVYRSIDDGNTWLLLSANGFPAANEIQENVRIAVKPDDPSVVYALIPSSGSGHVPLSGQLLGLYRYESSDNRWHKVSGIPNTLFGSNLEEEGQGWYDNAIAVDPNNVNRVIIGGSTIWTSINDIDTDDGFFNLFEDLTRATISIAFPGQWSATLYRCLISVSRQGATISDVSASASYIGKGVHSDVHAIVFSPADSQQLWVGCDGGVFHTGWPDGSDMVFSSRNHGLLSLTMNYMDLHPLEESILFCGTQDNGGLLYSGHESWELAADGDCGYFVVNWRDPRKVINTYTYAAVRRSTDRGKRDTFSNGGPSLKKKEKVLFYAPLVGAPPDSGNAKAADFVAFGSERLWVSELFSQNFLLASGWDSIPSNDLSDSTGAAIRAIGIASPQKIYAGNELGKVFRYVKTGSSWSRVEMLSAAGPNLPGNRVTAIAIDPADASGDTIYVAIGGVLGNKNHVWRGRFQAGAPPVVTWEPKGGNTAGKQLLDVQHNAIVIDPLTKFTYVGCDLGVWYTENIIVPAPEWLPYSQGLPDAGVIDLKLKGKALYASTHGRGVFKRRLDDIAPAVAVKLCLRSTLLDTGERHKETDGLTNPLNPDQKASILESPDILVEAPNEDGSFRSPANIGFTQYVDSLRDDTQRVPTHASSLVRSRVYVPVRNQGVGTPDGIQVTLLVANSSSGVPPLPTEHVQAIQNGIPFNTNTWKTVGIQKIGGLSLGYPKIATFELSAALLPPPNQVNSNTRCCLMAILHHPDDPHTVQKPGGGLETDVKKIAAQQRKTALRQIKIVKFEGTPPPLFPHRSLPGFVAIPDSATTHNAPLDDFLGKALYNNDQFFEGVLSRLLLSPLANNKQDDVPGLVLDPEKIIFAKEIEVTAPVNVGAVPLIWCAEKSITIKAPISAVGKGGQANQPGNFGGSGGGSASLKGQPCQIPVSQVAFLEGGDTSKDGKPLESTWASRAFSCLTFCKGGAGGANDGADKGGAGGGVVVLCAPLIKIDGGQIDASGAKGSGNAGGGGGGLVILIAQQIEGDQKDVNIKVQGGAKSGTGGIGGKGQILLLEGW